MSYEENFKIEHKFSHKSYNNIGAYGDDTTYYNCVCGAVMPYTEFPEHLEYWKKLKEARR